MKTKQKDCANFKCKLFHRHEQDKTRLKWFRGGGDVFMTSFYDLFHDCLLLSHTNTYTYTQSQTLTHTQTYTQTYMQTHKYTHRHTRAHTKTQSLTESKASGITRVRKKCVCALPIMCLVRFIDSKILRFNKNNSNNNSIFHDFIKTP